MRPTAGPASNRALAEYASERFVAYGLEEVETLEYRVLPRQTARDFHRPGGRPDAPLDRNLFADSSHDFEGVSGSTLPGLRFALDRGDTEEAGWEADLYRAALERRMASNDRYGFTERRDHVTMKDSNKRVFSSVNAVSDCADAGRMISSRRYWDTGDIAAQLGISSEQMQVLHAPEQVA